MKVKLELFNYATKAEKNATDVDTSDFVKKTDLASLKTNVDKLDIGKLKNVPSNLSNFKSKVDKLDVDKLVPVPIDLSKIIDVVKNDVVKKYVYNATIKDVEKKIPNTTNLATNTTLNTKINETKNEILSITNLGTTTVLTAVENKIPSNLVKKLTMTQRLVKLKIKLLLIMVMINILLLRNLIS